MERGTPYRVLSLLPIASNTFDQYFAPTTYYKVTVSWEAPGHLKSDMLVDDTQYFDSSPQVGMNVTIPGTLLKSTYAFKFMMVPQQRVVQTRTVELFWYGAGYQHTGGWGDTSWPLFHVYLDAATNHIHLAFDGGRQQSWGIGGFVNTYGFEKWDVDLGAESDFAKWTWFILQMDVQDKSFTKVIVGNKVIPFPPGYDRIKPADFYGSNVLNGILVGKLSGAPCTNAQILIDDVYAYADYWEPPSGGITTGWYFWLWELLMLMTGAGLTHYGQTKYK